MLDPIFNQLEYYISEQMASKPYGHDPYLFLVHFSLSCADCIGVYTEINRFWNP